MCPVSLKVAHTYSPAFPTSNRPFQRLVSARHEFAFLITMFLVSSFLTSFFGSAALFPLCSSPMLRFQFHHNISQQLSDVLFFHHSSFYGFVGLFRSSFLSSCLCAISTWLFWFAASQSLLLEPCPHFLFHRNTVPQLFASRRALDLCLSSLIAPSGLFIQIFFSAFIYSICPST